MIAPETCELCGAEIPKGRDDEPLLCEECLLQVMVADLLET